MKKNSLNKLLIVIAIITFIAVGTGITGVVLSLVVPLKLVAPDPFILPFVKENQDYVDISWNKVKDARYYTIEYTYALYPQNKRVLTIRENTLRIDRIKGDLTFRVMAVGRYLERNSDFSIQKTVKIDGIKLDTPMPDYDIISHTLKDGEIVHSLSFEFSEWLGVSYEYKGVKKYVVYYDLVFVGSGMDEEAEKNDLSPMSIDELRAGTFYIDQNMRVFLRATNKKGMFGDFDGSIQGEPVELYTLYQPSDWLLITME